jgi:hypothetical protein
MQPLLAFDWQLWAGSNFNESFGLARAVVYPGNSHQHATLVLIWPGYEGWENSYANSRFSTLCYTVPQCFNDRVTFCTQIFVRRIDNRTRITNCKWNAASEMLRSACVFPGCLLGSLQNSKAGEGGGIPGAQSSQRGPGNSVKCSYCLSVDALGLS